MNIDAAIAYVKPQLKTKRFDHTLRVAEVAVELANKYQVSQKDAELAALFHDYAKNRSHAELRRSIIRSRLPKDVLKYHYELWHGPAGSILVEQECGIKDSSILQAIRFHTTGRANMSELEKIIFVADYIEPFRNFPGVEEVRQMAREDLLTAAWLVSRNTIQYLISNKAQIYPDTFYAYNDLTNKLE